MNHSTPDSPTYEALKIFMRGEYPSTWLITGVAGFIGSNLLQELLQLDQKVVGLDNFATGHQRNLDEVQELVTPAQWSNFQFIKGDIRELADCHQACEGVDYVLHQAALGSVPRSLADPITTNAANITGFLNMLQAARAANGGVGTKSFVYAASSSTYGDHPGLPKVEELIGRPLSPYAVTKYVNELYAQIYSRCYGFNSIGLRYFNVFGPRQDPNGAYAAVIPKWIHSLLNGEVVFINGDGETSRDFTYVENVVQANILAAKSTSIAQNEIYNLAAGEQTSLNQLFDLICKNLQTYKLISTSRPEHRDFRSGDVRHSLADISKAKRLLNYHPAIRVESGIFETIRWHLKTRC